MEIIPNNQSKVVFIKRVVYSVVGPPPSASFLKCAVLLSNWWGRGRKIKIFFFLITCLDMKGVLYIYRRLT
jgi:hypothetical protein